jgi:hypothetical protein
MRIELTSEAKKQMSGLADRQGMTQVALMSRLVQWFADAGDNVQALVLNHMPGELRPEVVRLVLEQMATKRGA